MNISIGIIDFLMLALVVQGLILAVVLAFSSKKIYSNRYIAAFILVVAESTLLMELDYLGFVQKYTVFADVKHYADQHLLPLKPWRFAAIANCYGRRAVFIVAPL